MQNSIFWSAKSLFVVAVIQFCNIASSEMEPQATKVEIANLLQLGKYGWALHNSN